MWAAGVCRAFEENIGFLPGRQPGRVGVSGGGYNPAGSTAEWKNGIALDQTDPVIGLAASSKISPIVDFTPPASRSVQHILHGIASRLQHNLDNRPFFRNQESSPLVDRISHEAAYPAHAA